MFTPWILLLITIVYSHGTETTTSSPNITTLYPVNKTLTRNETDCIPRKKPTPQTWKLEATFVESNLTEIEDSSEKGEKKNLREEKSKERQETYKGSEDKNKAREVKNKEREEKKEEVIEKEEIKDFKPSQHLGSFFDEDSAEVIKTPISGPIIKKPASGFVSSVKNEYLPPVYNNIPKEIYQTHKEFPYKFDDAIYSKPKPSWQDESMESRPTVEAPSKVPAGGFYKAPVTFKEKPHSDEVFGLDINEEAKEHGLKKRANPWHNLLRMVTAFIPVGLIISALTPSVITIQNVDDHRDPSGVYRRSDSGVADIAPISERCRRRLLCELQSERHYASPSSPPRRNKKCYKIHCEDTEALWKMLRWLFTYNQPLNDDRGRHLT